jgi:NAD(P)-dependent dehydrogenase (short-subunit alcohol dehydrogenase family)
MDATLVNGWYVVTGGTSGVGRAVAIELAKKGYSVVILGRDSIKARETAVELRNAGAPRADFLTGDLSSLQDVRRLADELRVRFSPIAALVNNAGALFLRRQLSRDGFEMTWALNHLAYFLLTTLLLDVIVRTSTARIVNVASEAHAKGRIDFDDPCRVTGPAAYSQSKLANVMFTRSLSGRLQGTNVTANAIHPGRVASRFGANNGWVWRVARPFVHRNAITPEDSAPAVTRLLLDPSLAKVSGRYFDRSEETEPAPQAFDDGLCEQLWVLSERMTSEPALFASKR